MAEDKIVGEYNGAQAREVMISIEDWEAMSGASGGDRDEGAKPQAALPAPMTAANVQPRPKRVTKILPEEAEYEDREAEADADQDADVAEDESDEEWDEEESDEGDEEEADDELWEEEDDSEWDDQEEDKRAASA
jgi:hypothetical protein